MYIRQYFQIFHQNVPKLKYSPFIASIRRQMSLAVTLHDEKALAALSNGGEEDPLELLVVVSIRQDEQVEAGVGSGQAATC
jgi:hypothetical protein